MKLTSKVLLASIMAGALLTACGNNDDDKNTDKNADVVTTASIVNEADAVVNALSEKGTWIVATLNDITIDKEIVVAGEFHDKGDSSNDIYRKLALYTQDDDHNIIDSFSLTAPKMTVQSENFKIQGGTFVGDIYVEANGFSLDKTAKVEGTIEYANAEVEASAVIEGEVTAAGESTDVVTTASIVNDGEAVINGLSEDGTWIVATLNDITVDKEIVVAGEFHNKGDSSQDIYRKLGLYTQDDDHNITASFSLTAPKMTVQSENFKIQGGTFVGDVYVEANGFSLDKTAKVEGNIYYTSEDVKATAVIEGEVSGAQEVK